MNLLAKKIQSVCGRKGLTQADLVKKSGLAASIIFRAWNGTNIPNEDNMRAIAGAVGGDAEKELMAACERMRKRDDQLWLAFPPDLLCAPVVRLVQNWTGLFYLEAGHSYTDTAADGIMLARQVAVKLANPAGGPHPMTSSFIREALLDGTLDGAFVPHSLYLAHRDTLRLYAELSVQHFSVRWLLVSASGKHSNVKTFDAAWALEPEFCVLAESEGEREFAQLRLPSEAHARPVVCESAVALLETVQERIAARRVVMCLVGDPLAAWLEQRLGEDELHITTIARQSADYLCEALPSVGRARMDLVLSLDGAKRAQDGWMQQMIGKLNVCVDSINRKEDDAMREVARSLSLDMNGGRMRETLLQMGLFELTLAPQALKLLS